MRVARGTVVDVLAGEVVGVFAHVQRADKHRAGSFQAFDQGRVARRGRAVAIDLRAGHRWQARDVEQVLDREWHAGQRPEPLAALARCVDFIGACQRALLGYCGEGIERAVLGADARQCSGNDLARGNLSVMDGIGDGVGGRPGEVHGVFVGHDLFRKPGPTFRDHALGDEYRRRFGLVRQA